jgi:hypothetical protein
MLTRELAALFARDLTRLQQEIAAFSGDQALWQAVPGVTNPAGNLVLHLEGNLREYIGRQLGGIAYTRQRGLEFSQQGFTCEDLAARAAQLSATIPGVIASLTEEQLNAEFPERVAGSPLSSRQFLFSIYGHLNYHLGQIDYIRRVLTAGAAVKFATL